MVIKMGFFDKINNNVIVNAVKQILERGKLDKSMSDSVQFGTLHRYVSNCEWYTARLPICHIFNCLHLLFCLTLSIYSL